MANCLRSSIDTISRVAACVARSTTRGRHRRRVPPASALRTGTTGRRDADRGSRTPDVAWTGRCRAIGRIRGTPASLGYRRCGGRNPHPRCCSSRRERTLSPGCPNTSRAVRRTRSSPSPFSSPVAATPSRHPAYQIALLRRHRREASRRTSTPCTGASLPKCSRQTRTERRDQPPGQAPHPRLRSARPAARYMTMYTIRRYTTAEPGGMQMKLMPVRPRRPISWAMRMVS